MSKNLGLSSFVAASILLISHIASASAEIHSEPDIRVRIASVQKEVEIAGTDLRKRVGSAEQVKKYDGRQSLRFNCKPLKKYRNLDKPLLLATIDSSTGLLGVKGGKYRGSLLLVAPKSAKGCDVVNSVGLETYIGAVLAKEMSPDWPLEALKAQAVAARSYALYKIKTRQVSASLGYEAYYDLENSEKHQVNGDFFDVTVSTSMAQRTTKGEVLSLEAGKLSPIFFHSKCGGETRRPDQVWTNKVEGYRNVKCPYCHDRGPKNWRAVLTKKKFYSAVDRALANYKSGKLSKGHGAFKVAPAKFSDARLRVYDDDKLLVMKKSRIRTTLGRRYTLSNSFSVEPKAEKVIIEGRGFGHGVGLCQYGALEMAKRGYNYKQILKHYFPEFKLDKLY